MKKKKGGGLLRQVQRGGGGTARGEQAGTGFLGLGTSSGGLLSCTPAQGGLRPGARTRPPCSSAYDARLRQKVAVKKLSRPFQSLIHARRTYRELRLLKHLKHENVRGRASGVGIEQRTPPGGGRNELGGSIGGTPPRGRGRALPTAVLWSVLDFLLRS